MKKIKITVTVCLLLAILLSVSALASADVSKSLANANVVGANSNEKSIKVGDVNNDGNINAKDLLRLRQHIADWKLSNEDYNNFAADCNCDGNTNSKDIMELRKYLSGFPDEYQIGTIKNVPNTTDSTTEGTTSEFWNMQYTTKTYDDGSILVNVGGMIWEGEYLPTDSFVRLEKTNVRFPECPELPLYKLVGSISTYYFYSSEGIWEACG